MVKSGHSTSVPRPYCMLPPLSSWTTRTRYCRLCDSLQAWCVTVGQVVLTSVTYNVRGYCIVCHLCGPPFTRPRVQRCRQWASESHFPTCAHPRCIDRCLPHCCMCHARWFVISIYTIDYQLAINQFIILGKMYHSAREVIFSLRPFLLLLLLLNVCSSSALSFYIYVDSLSYFTWVSNDAVLHNCGYLYCLFTLFYDEYHVKTSTKLVMIVLTVPYATNDLLNAAQKVCIWYHLCYLQ